VADVAPLLVVPEKDVVSNRLVRFPMPAAGFHHSGFTKVVFSPPTLRMGAYKVQNHMAPEWARCMWMCPMHLITVK
jgi:hypothetical protein